MAMLRSKSVKLINRALFFLLLTVFCSQSMAQDLEPRRWSHLPSGLNVFGLASGWTDGDIFFDPVLLIEDVTFELYAAGAGYVRTFGLFGKSSRIDFNLPYASGRWEGIVDGEYTSIRRRGLMDPRLRFSINLYGAPALKGGDFVKFKGDNPVNTTIGAALAVTLPFGDYDNTKLINLGGNRMVYRPQLGILHQRRNLQLELTGSVFLFETNDEFWNGNVLKQDPLWFVQAHVIYSFRPGWWASVSGGFAHGGRSEVNGVPKIDDRRKRYIALSLGVPINQQQGLKFTYLTSDTHIETGANTNALLMGWTFVWGGR
jgi:hypothetical protein